jgi:hypothetical protein
MIPISFRSYSLNVLAPVATPTSRRSLSDLGRLVSDALRAASGDKKTSSSLSLGEVMGFYGVSCTGIRGPPVAAPTILVSVPVYSSVEP